MKERQEKEVKEDSQWDKKRIILFVVTAVVLLAIGFEVKSLFIGESQIPVQKQSVQGVATKASLNPPSIKKNIQDQITSLQNEARNINLQDMATSSPQVQKVIKDLQALENLPKNQLKSTCEKICGGL